MGIIENRTNEALKLIDKAIDLDDRKKLEEGINLLVEVADNNVHYQWHRGILDDAVRKYFHPEMFIEKKEKPMLVEECQEQENSKE